MVPNLNRKFSLNSLFILFVVLNSLAALRHLRAVLNVYRAIRNRSKPTIADIAWMYDYQDLSQTEMLFGEYDGKVFFAKPVVPTPEMNSHLFRNWVGQVASLALGFAACLLFFAINQPGFGWVVLVTSMALQLKTLFSVSRSALVFAKDVGVL